jgi:hypothetical protein
VVAPAKRPLWLLVGLLAAGCVVPPPARTPKVDVLVADARARANGSSAEEVLSHPAARGAAPALFGADWEPAGPPPAGLSAPAREFFLRSEPPRLVRIDGVDYVAASGCLPRACATHRGLLLARVDREEMLARLDEGGFTHYYFYGTGVTDTPPTRALVDAAWRALRALSG